MDSNVKLFNLGFRVPIQDIQRKMLSETVFKEPFTETTLKARKHVLFASVLSILLTTYDITLNKTPWLDIEVSKSSPNVLLGLLSVSLLYFLLIFLFYVWEDFRRWRLAGSLLDFEDHYKLVSQANENLRGTEYHLRNILKKLPIDNPNNKYLSDVKDMISKSKYFIGSYERNISDVKNEYHILGLIQWFKLLFIELGVPIIMGIYGLYLISGSILPFIKALG